MENAIDALEIAFAVLIFTMALTVTLTMFSRANEVSQLVLKSSDITQYYTYEENAGEEGQSRIVGLETIIPTLYKYYKENYTVLFLDEDGDPLPLYYSQTDRDLWGSVSDPQTGIIGKYYDDNNDNNCVCAFDVDDETIRHEPWTGTPLDFKKNLDAFLEGKTFNYPSGADSYKYGEKRQLGGFIDRVTSNKWKFKETLGEYTYNIPGADRNELLKERKKRVIIYQLMQ